MKIVIGGIYEISKEWHPYDEDIINHRTCIVVKEEDSYVYVTLMNVFHSNSQKDKKIFIEYFIDDNKYISAISCDVIHRINKNLLINNLGCVSSDIVSAIIQCNGNILPSIQYIKLYNNKDEHKDEIEIKHKDEIENEDNSNNPINNKENNILINDKLQMLNILSDIYQDTSITRKITEKTNKKINIWKERWIGFLFGVLSSFFASIIYENRFIFTNFLYRKISEILKYIMGLCQ